MAFGCPGHAQGPIKHLQRTREAKHEREEQAFLFTDYRCAMRKGKAKGNQRTISHVNNDSNYYNPPSAFPTVGNKIASTLILFRRGC